MSPVSARLADCGARLKSFSIAKEAIPAVAVNRRAAPSTIRLRLSGVLLTTRNSRTGANKVWRLGAGLGAEVSLKDFRKDITLDLYNEAGQLVLSYKIYRCWVSEYQILPDLDANANAIAIEQIRLENEGWERDHSVVEPIEPKSKKS
jgi:hypothetical protein